MADNPVWAICERVAEVQALLDDHIAGGKHSALLRAMFDVGYLPLNTPPDAAGLIGP
jgi:hypothetical protein